MIDHLLRGAGRAITRSSLHLGFLVGSVGLCAAESPPITPSIVTSPVTVDSDDPAIWIHAQDPSRSLILGTDKGGLLFAWTLDGRPHRVITRPGARRLNNVDVEYDVDLGSRTVDLAMATDRDANRIFVYTLPDFTPLDNGGIPAFAGESDRRPMGIAIYRREDGTAFAIVSRKSGPEDAYLWQYRLQGDSDGNVALTHVRSFGRWSGLDAEGSGEIEAVAVVDANGYVYYSDEGFGIRKYHADPDHPEAQREIASFGTTNFAEDREGIAIYAQSKRHGVLVVSDQQANRFNFYATDADRPDRHPFLGSLSLSTISTDGVEVTSTALPGYPRGILVAMTEDRLFHVYDWAVIARVLGLK